MNELVKDLLKQSTYEILGVPQVDQKKFSELIVRECCQMMIDLERKYPANLTVKEIKEHFGVEE